MSELCGSKRASICGYWQVPIPHHCVCFLRQHYILPDLTQEHAQPPRADRAPLPGGLPHAAPQQHDEARQHLQRGGLRVRPRAPSRLHRHRRGNGEEEVDEGRHHVAAV